MLSESFVTQVSNLALDKWSVDQGNMLNKLVGFLEGYVIGNSQVPDEIQKSLVEAIIKAHASSPPVKL